MWQIHRYCPVFVIDRFDQIVGCRNHQFGVAIFDDEEHIDRLVIDCDDRTELAKMGIDNGIADV